MHRARHRQIILPVFFFFILGLLTACSGEKQTNAATPPAAVPVVVTKVIQKDMPLQVNAIGSIEPYSSVQVKSQVAAQLQAVHFKEGDMVRKGQLLFTLDKRQFEAELNRARGTLAQDVAKAANAKAQAQRYAALLKEGVVAKEQADAMQTAAEQAEAAVEADKAAVEAAKLNVQYCSIYSPIDGRAGSYTINVGNLVKENDTALVSINQIRPIYATFTVPESTLADIKRHMGGGKLVVRAMTPNSSDASVGQLAFVDNAVDRQTGTIRLKASFKNADNKLWPGQFVNVVMTLATERNATVVPNQAIQSGQQGSFVFVVKGDNIAENRNVTVGRTIGGEAVVTKGLEVGETVITDGQMRVVPGSRVEPRTKTTGAVKSPVPSSES
jgi:membrane fusion protein, multidrug efflux system